MKVNCVFCSAPVEVDPTFKIGRLEECPKCGKYLHMCLQCKFYDRSYHNQCRETEAPQVADKESANFCEFFQMGRDVQVENKTVDDAKKKLEKLFKTK